MRQDAPLSSDGYPAARLDFLKSKKKWYVIVSIPSHLKHLFSKQVDLRRSTGTGDKATAQRKVHGLAQQIYSVFDERQKEAARVKRHRTDAYAVKAIMDAARAFKYNRGDIPKLEPRTRYSELEKMKQALDSYVQLVRDDEPDLLKRLNAASEVTRAAKRSGEELSVKIDSNDLRYGPSAMALPKETPENTEWLKKLRLARSKSDDAFKGDKLVIVQAYDTAIVSSYWQDLLTFAAREQSLPIPTFGDFEGAALVDVNGTFIPQSAVNAVQQMMAKAGDVGHRKFLPIDRTRQTKRAVVPTLSSVMDEYISYVRRDYDVVDTQNKLIRWAQQFVDLMGDLKIAEIKPKHGYDYCDLILQQRPSLKNKTIKDYCWGVFALLKHCVKKDYIQSNPFSDLDLNNYGADSVEWQPYTQAELRKLFSYDWSEQDRLLLSLLATTGMRPSEAGNLTWERFNDTEHVGIRYFTTKHTAFEKVRVKNRGSARDIPLHPSLKLPPTAKGRLFDYEQDKDGRCSTDIAHKLNPILKTLVPHPYKTVRSFRKTFKQIMRKAKVSEEVHDFMTGHGQGETASRKNYGGMGVEVVFDALSKCDFSFLNSK